MSRWFVSALAVVSLTANAQFLRTVVPSDPTKCVTWSDRQMEYQVDAAGSARTPGETEFTALDQAFSAWQAVSDRCSDFRFIRGQRVTNGNVGKGTNLLIFREVDCRDVVPVSDPCLSDGSCANAYRCWDHGADTIALTTVTYSVRTGIAVDADIEFNAGGYFMTTISSPPCERGRESAQCVAYDVQNTATHEIGHMVGFDHVELASSTMAPTAPIGELSKRTIDPGTSGGFCSTYPRGQPPVPCDELALLRSRIIARNTGSFGQSCVGSTSGLEPWVLLGLLSLVRRRPPRIR